MAFRPKLNGFIDSGATFEALAVGTTVRAVVGTVGTVGTSDGTAGSALGLSCGNVMMLGGADFGKVQEAEERSIDSRATRDRDRVCCRSAEGIAENTSGMPGH